MRNEHKASLAIWFLVFSSRSFSFSESLWRLFCLQCLEGLWLCAPVSTWWVFAAGQPIFWGGSVPTHPLFDSFFSETLLTWILNFVDQPLSFLNFLSLSHCQLSVYSSPSWFYTFNGLWIAFWFQSSISIGCMFSFANISAYIFVFFSLISFRLNHPISWIEGLTHLFSDLLNFLLVQLDISLFLSYDLP